MSIWKNKGTAEILNVGNKNTMVEHLGIEITEVGEDYIKGTMPVDERTKQPYGLLHGGASAVLSETLGSIAANMCVDINTHYAVGLDISATHLKSATNGIVTGICKPIKIGRKVQVWQTQLFNDKNQMICDSKLTVMVLQK